MRLLILALTLILSSTVLAEVCPGPGLCIPTGPSELCLPEGCSSVFYTLDNGFAIVSTKMLNGYPMMGWAGPCLLEYSQCPDLLNQAWADLRQNVLRANRAQRYE